MAIVVGIDPSLTSTGLAILKHGQPTLLTAIGNPGTAGAPYPERSDRIGRQTRHTTETLQNWLPQTHLAIIEGPSYDHNLPSNFDRAGLWWRLYATLRARHIPIAVIAPKTRALWATGNGDADKKTVTQTVKNWWPHARDHIRNDDIADAAALALAGAFHCGDPMPFPIKPQHHNRLKAVQWPTLSPTKPDTTQAGATP